MLDTKVLSDFWAALTKASRQNFDSEINKANIEYYREGIVLSTNTDAVPNTATIELAFDTLYDIPNLSGATLNKGQKVKVFYNNKSMAGCYIGTAF